MSSELREKLVMNQVDRFASAYIDYYSNQHVWGPDMVLVERDRSGSEWVIYDLPELTKKDPDLLWDIIMEVLRRSPSSEVIEVLAAGPMEEYLVAHGENEMEKIEIQAKVNFAFKDLLAGVWKNNMSEAVWKKVCELRDESDWKE